MGFAIDLMPFYAYLKKTKHEESNHLVEIVLNSKPNELVFTIRLEIAKPEEQGSFFQSDFSLEQHKEGKHIEPHVQIHIHGAKEEEKIGTFYFVIHIKDQEDLEDTAKGFLYSIKEILEVFEEKIPNLTSKMLNLELIEELSIQREHLTKKLIESFKTNNLELKDANNKSVILTEPEKIKILINQRRELEPLLLPIIN